MDFDLDQVQLNRRSFLAGGGVAAAGAFAAASGVRLPSVLDVTHAPKKPAGYGWDGTPIKDVKGNLLVWDSSLSPEDTAEDAIFRQIYPHVNLTHVAQPSANYLQLLQAALTTNQAPDAFTLGAGTQVAQFHSQLQKLDHLITKQMRAGITGWDRMSPTASSTNNTYALPLDNSGWMMFFNKALFREVGLDPAKPPTTWKSLREAVYKFKRAGITPFAGGDYLNIMMEVWLFALLPGVLDIKASIALGNGKLKWNSPQVRPVFQAYQQAIQEEWFQKTWRSDFLFVQQPALFEAGKAAMTLTLINYVGLFNTALHGQLGIMLPPSNNKANKLYYFPFAPSIAWCMNKNSHNKTAAWAWQCWRMSKQSQTRDVNALSTADPLQDGRLPTNKSVSPQRGAPGAVREVVRVARSVTNFIGPLGLAPPQLLTALIQNTAGFESGTTSIAQVCNAMDQANAQAGIG